MGAGDHRRPGIAVRRRPRHPCRPGSRRPAVGAPDAALLLHDQGRGEDDAAAYLQRWLLAPPERARQMLRFLTSPLWRAYISTYVGAASCDTWLDVAVSDEERLRRDDERLRRFGRLLDEPLIRRRCGPNSGSGQVGRRVNRPVGAQSTLFGMTQNPDSVNALSLAELDPDVAAAMAGELSRQRDTLEMIASENFVPRAVLQAQGSV